VTLLVDFQKDEAAQELLGYAGILEPYESVISRVSLEILRESVANCEIESIRFLRSAGRHQGMRAGGMPTEEGSSHIRLQDMTMPFDVEISVCTGVVRHKLDATFIFECRKMDETPENEYRLEIHCQQDA
jgi:hypothetical protein